MKTKILLSLSIATGILSLLAINQSTTTNTSTTQSTNQKPSTNLEKNESQSLTPENNIQDQKNPHQENSIAAEIFLEDYEKNHIGKKIYGKMNLDTVQGLGLSASKENIQKISRLIKSSTSPDEKSSLIQIYADLYRKSNDIFQKNIIKLEIEDISKNSDNKEVLHAAVLSFSRMGYFESSIPILERAKSINAIDLDEYSGELAHLIPFAPSPIKSSMIDQIKDSNSEYGIEVLTMLLNNEVILSDMSAESREKSFKLLQANEPRLPQNTSNLGITDAIKFNKWFEAISKIEEFTNDKSYTKNLITDPDTDIRKLIAIAIDEKSIRNLSRNDETQISILEKSIEKHIALNKLEKNTNDLASLALQQIIRIKSEK